MKLFRTISAALITVMLPLTAQAAYETFMIQDMNSRMCWHVRGASNEFRADIITWNCRDDMEHFKFEFIPTNDSFYPDTYYIRDRNSKLCLHVKGASTESRAPLWTWSCSQVRGKPHAMFKLIPANSGYLFIQDANSQKCMHVRGASHELRAEIWTWNCNDVRDAEHAKFKLIKVP